MIPAKSEHEDALIRIRSILNPEITYGIIKISLSDIQKIKILKDT